MSNHWDKILTPYQIMLHVWVSWFQLKFAIDKILSFRETGFSKDQLAMELTCLHAPTKRDGKILSTLLELKFTQNTQQS